jgi:hypothetical protein
MEMNEAARTRIRASLVDAFDTTCYKYRSGEITRDQFVTEISDLETIGGPVGWKPNYTEAVYAELHRRSKEPLALPGCYGARGPGLLEPRPPARPPR